MMQLSKLALAVTLATGLSACGGSGNDSPENTPENDDNTSYSLQSVPEGFVVKIPQSLRADSDSSKLNNSTRKNITTQSRVSGRNSLRSNRTIDDSETDNGSTSLAYEEVQYLASEAELQSMQVELALLMIDTSFQTIETKCSSTALGEECSVDREELSVEFTPDILKALKEIDDKYDEAWGYDYATSYAEYCAYQESCPSEEDYNTYGRFAEFLSQNTELGDITFVEYDAGSDFAYSVSIEEPGVWNSAFEDSITVKWSEDKKTIRVVYEDSSEEDDSFSDAFDDDPDYSTTSIYDYSENIEGLNSVHITQKGSYGEEEWSDTLKLVEKNADGTAVDISFNSRLTFEGGNHEYKVSGSADENGGELTTKYSGTYEFEDSIENYSFSYSEKFDGNGQLVSYAFCDDANGCTQDEWYYYEYDEENGVIVEDDDVDYEDYEYYYAQVDVTGVELEVNESFGSYVLCLSDTLSNLSWDQCIGYGYIENYESTTFEDFYLYTSGYENSLDQIYIYRENFDSEDNYDGIELVEGASVTNIIEDYEEYFTSETELPETATAITNLADITGIWASDIYEDTYLEIDQAGNWTYHFGIDEGCVYTASGTLEFKEGGYIRLDEYSEWAQVLLDGDKAYTVYNYDGWKYIEGPDTRINNLPSDFGSSECSFDLDEYETDEYETDEYEDYDHETDDYAIVEM